MRETLPEDGKDDASNRSQPFDDAELAKRRDDLAASIGKQRKKSALQAEKNRDGSDTGWGVAVKVSSEFIAGIAVGAILGYGFDSYFETSPWGLIVLLMLGFAAGVLNVLRSVGKVADRPKL
ncbi:AtpZ/AtpI family protein [Rhizobium sp. EC-SD404]|uniref:AtpZ/AtpI family protein n=1 Tax=Rhizobium sp. EC-SD404 TaxID=2038389 RepID=UPI0012551129|nr:AtpZ/AtpI family protein [Rhizobium sp. EC-SD404]VVT27449.1 ATP synthase protein I [Rhizobium sp. EC-SD404]